MIAIPVVTAAYRRLRSGVPFWYRAKQYGTTVRAYDSPHRSWIIGSRFIPLALLGGWCFAARYTDKSSILDEDYKLGKVKLAVEYRNEFKL